MGLASFINRFLKTKIDQIADDIKKAQTIMKVLHENNPSRHEVGQEKGIEFGKALIAKTLKIDENKINFIDNREHSLDEAAVY